MKNLLFKVLSLHLKVQKYTFIFKIHTFIGTIYILICEIHSLIWKFQTLN